MNRSLKTLGIIKAFNALHALTEKDKSKDYVFASATRIRMGGNLRRLRDLVERIQTEQNALVEAHGIAIGDGKFEVKPDSEKWDEFKKASKDLSEALFDVELVPMTGAELINTRVVKSRDEKGHVSENTVENQVPFDLIADLQSTDLLTE